MARGPGFQPKIYKKHRQWNQTPSQWYFEHKLFEDGEFLDLYSTKKKTESIIDGYEARLIHHPNINTILQNAMPAEMLKVKTASTENSQILATSQILEKPHVQESFIQDTLIEVEERTPEELERLAKIRALRQEGEILRAKEHYESKGDIYRLGLNRKGWNTVRDCGYGIS